MPKKNVSTARAKSPIAKKFFSPRRKAKTVKQKTAGRALIRKTTSLRKLSKMSGVFTKHEKNPIIEPSHHPWESKATFNPAAIYEDGKVHILYRAIGDNDVSVFGYASSGDGLYIGERLNAPAYQHKRGAVKSAIKIPYASGGGWNGGSEDPRLVSIDGEVHMIYTAFDGWGSLRMALASIGLEDFLNKKWDWSEPVMISPTGEIHKNWVLFPEKINGKYALLHSISPEILVDYFDSLDDLKSGKVKIRSRYGRVAEKESSGAWDSWTRGAGPPPIKTKYGWLVFYHAMEDVDPNKYKLGAMILDLKYPSKVLYRCARSVLEPEECYENEGFKSGVIYSCGAVVANGKLLLYYGGGDKVACAAYADFEKFLDNLVKTGKPRLKPAKLTAK